MRSSVLVTCVLGLALGASDARTQDTARTRPRAEQRIKVSKGEVALAGAPRIDTVFVTRTDTIFLTRLDTVRVPRMVVRVDTVVRPALPPPIVPRGAVYLGLYGGPTAPSGNVDRLYGSGAHIGGALGWENENAVLGARFTTDVTQLSREQGFASSVVGTVTPLMVTIGSDLKVIPVNFASWRFYGLGGVNYHVFRGIATVSKPGTGACTVDGRGGCYQPTNGSNWKSKPGFHFGAGTDFRVASQEMFLEARVTALEANGARTWLLPISFGLRFF